LIDQHGLQAVIYLGNDVSDTDAFHTLRAVRIRGQCMTLSVGVTHPDSPARLIKSADVVVDGPVCAKAFFDGWRLQLQLNAKDNDHETAAFFLNIAYDAIVYALDSPERLSGKLLWER
jgi:hypothetical protein